MANEPLKYNAGVVTAYGAAVRGGYTGTYEDFCRQQAGYAESAAAVEHAKEEAVEAAETAIELVGGYNEMTVESTKLPQGSQPTSVIDRTGDHPVLRLGLVDGATGPQGPKGDKGDKGDQGIQGPKGDTGAMGPRGYQGLQGPKGDTGATGPRGLLGPTGPKGDTGATGATGPKGDTGEDGFSPTVTVEAVIGGHTVTITDAVGEHPFNVMDGAGNVSSVNGKTGVVILDGNDINLDDTAATPEKITTAVSNLNRALNNLDEEKYEKPSGGIPASDLADGVIPDVPVQDVQVDGQSVVDGQGIADIPLGELADRKADVVIVSVSGAIASFADGADDMPLRDCVVQIEPVQSGSGDPSPDNVRPITGRTGCNIFRIGKNLANAVEGNIYSEQQCTRVFKNGGIEITSTNSYGRVGLAFPVKNGEIYTISAKIKASGTIVRVGLSSENGWEDDYGVLAGATNVGTTLTTFSKTITAISDVVHLECYAGTSGVVLTLEDIQLELSPAVTSYEPYQGQTYPISWQTEAGTVYGGYVDPVKGELVVNRAGVDLGTLTWIYNSNWGGGGAFYCDTAPSGIKTDNPTQLVPNALCSCYTAYARDTLYSNSGLTGFCIPNNTAQVSIRDSAYTDAATFKSAMSGVQLVYELAEPIVYQLTPTEIRTILGGGINNIWADCGDTAVQYPADTKAYVDGHGGGVQIEIDSSLSGTSTNPVQNKVIKTALDGKEPKHDTITVSGTTPSITGAADTRYVCGEVSTLTIVPPASGDCEVIFESGTTATVLTITPPTGVTAVNWANGFDPTSLDANNRYDLIITDGEWGIAAAWAV